MTGINIDDTKKKACKLFIAGVKVVPIRTQS